MGLALRRSLPVERPAGPLHGYKLAYPMLSADGGRSGFGGVWSSGQAVYGLSATAVCFWNGRHSPPKRRCTCGFYCLHTYDAALAMACDAQYRSTVIIEVAVAGRFIRYDDGFRYSSQRVLSARTHRCLCGSPATVLVDSGTGITGWRRLRPCCQRCSLHKETLTLPEFGDLLGDPTLATVDARIASRPGPGLAAGTCPGPDGDTGSAVSVLTAEVALLQARVDSLQAQLSRLTR
ncbi:MAG TPA: hypothetical protein VFN68_00260 [Acidimicrobiales bacterium]|nr:hypothetical protein [Acidimicrobiales bacterium]